MYGLIISIHVLVSIFLIFVILLQPGKGDAMAFSSGGGNAAAGGRGQATLLSKITAGCAIVFMLTSLTLAYRSSRTDSVLSARRNLATQKAETKPPDAPLPTGQTAPASATGGAAVPVPGTQAPGAPAPPAPRK